MKYLVFSLLFISAHAYACLDFFTCPDPHGRGRIEISFLNEMEAWLIDFRESPRVEYRLHTPLIHDGAFEFRLNESDEYRVRFQWAKNHFSEVTVSVDGTETDCKPMKLGR